MRVAVTGTTGQLVTAMTVRAAARDVEVVPVGRPDLDLLVPATVYAALAAIRPDVVVNAAAFTAVDAAESAIQAAYAINADGAGHVARAARQIGVPLLHISTDYVFDGLLQRPLREDDATAPLGVYGASKLAGEQQVAAATPDHAIVRTQWVYSPYGRNFVKTMLALGENRYEVSVVADQFGSPTSALDLAEAVIDIAHNLGRRPQDTGLRGVFHVAAGGEANWADVAEHVFATAVRAGRAPVAVRRITTSEYPTPARRPANSRLDCSLVADRHGVRLPQWQSSVAAVTRALLANNQQPERSVA